MALPVMQLCRQALINTNICRVAGNLANIRQDDHHACGFATLKQGSTPKLPPPPKRPPTGFILYVTDTRPNVVRQNPSLKPTEVIQAIAAKWKSADESTKQKYANLSRQRREEFLKQKELYDSKLTAEQKDAIKEVAIEKKLKSSKKKLSETLRQLEKPKGPRTAYVLYTTEKRSVVQDKLPKEVMTTLAQMWKELPEDKKKPYYERAEADRARYESEMSAWIKKMEKEGKWEVVNDLKEDIRELRREHDPLKRNGSKS